MGRARIQRLLAGDRTGRLEERLTWIWGAPRSGSSWLLALLTDPLVPDLNAPLGFRPPGADTGVRPDAIPLDEFLFASHLVPWDGNPVDVYGEWWPGSINGFSSGRPSYFLSDAYRDAWEPEMRRLVLRRLDAVVERARTAVPELPSEPAIVIKETPSGHGADQVMSLLPRSRALLLVRDPRDVVDSLLHAFKPGGFMARQYGKAYETPDERAAGAEWGAKLWAMSMDVGRAAVERHDPALARTVRYEDLLADTVAELGALLTWLGRGRDPEAVERIAARHAFANAAESGELNRVRSARPGRWRESLGERETAIVTEIAGERIARYGYDD